MTAIAQYAGDCDRLWKRPKWRQDNQCKPVPPPTCSPFFASFFFGGGGGVRFGGVGVFPLGAVFPFGVCLGGVRAMMPG